MGKKLDLAGQRFGRLVALEECGRGKYGEVLWRCVCDCGNEKVIRAAELRYGGYKSCGCIRTEVTTSRNTVHGGCHTRLYSIWKGMRARCNYPGHVRYKDYGGRGIHVCSEWEDFTVFRDWALSNGYEEHLTVDRIDVNRGYSPDNCRWATYKEQRHNRRNTRTAEP